jgi:hypothetical protein
MYMQDHSLCQYRSVELLNPTANMYHRMALITVFNPETNWSDVTRFKERQSTAVPLFSTIFPAPSLVQLHDPFAPPSPTIGSIRVPICIDIVETIFRGADDGCTIISIPLPWQLLPVSALTS